MKLNAQAITFVAFFSAVTPFVFAVPAAGQIYDCEAFANKVTSVVDDSFRTKGGMSGAEVNELQKSYPATPRNHLQFYLGAAGLSWASSRGDANAVFGKTLETCSRFH